MDMRLMTPSDVLNAIEGWNSVLIHDRLSEDEFRKAILDKPDYDPNGTFVSVNGGSVAGFITTHATGGEQGFIAAYYFRPQYTTTQLPDELLQCASDYLKAKGVMRIKVAGYDKYLGPGVDLRYDFLLTSLKRAGYEWKKTVDDMECELSNWKPTAYQQDKIRQAKDYGVRVVDYTEFTAETLLEWSKRAARQASWDWFWEWWEYGPTMVIAARGDEIIGFANYWPEGTLPYGPTETHGALAPIGVLPEHRGYGIGTWLLVESMLRVQKHGRLSIWANQTNTPFYLPNGWKVYRQFAVFEKAIRM